MVFNAGRDAPPRPPSLMADGLMAAMMRRQKGMR